MGVACTHCRSVLRDVIGWHWRMDKIIIILMLFIMLKTITEFVRVRLHERVVLSIIILRYVDI